MLLCYNMIMPRTKLYEKENTVVVSVRLPQSLKQQMQKLARENRRSLGQQIVWTLEKGLGREKEPRHSEEQPPSS